ncbi:hypothetical protein MKEN_00914700 [Mycena kentingensis (nom. inval.)]|nr:hypothetical protein MKEN_00914700 [Mycena kentingensis (nom. inval.)]
MCQRPDNVAAAEFEKHLEALGEEAQRADTNDFDARFLSLMLPSFSRPNSPGSDDARGLSPPESGEESPENLSSRQGSRPSSVSSTGSDLGPLPPAPIHHAILFHTLPDIVRNLAQDIRDVDEQLRAVREQQGAPHTPTAPPALDNTDNWSRGRWETLLVEHMVMLRHLRTNLMDARQNGETGDDSSVNGDESSDENSEPEGSEHSTDSGADILARLDSL